MDRYGASTRDLESYDGSSTDHSRRSGKQSGRDQRSHSPKSDSSSSWNIDSPALRTRRGAVAYTSGASLDQSNHEPRAHHRSRRSEEEPRRRDLSPIIPTYDFNDPELGLQDRSVCGYAIRRPDPRFSGERSDDDSDIDPRVSRGGQSGPRLRRAPGLHGRPDLSFNSDYAEGESEESSGSRREGSGSESSLRCEGDARGGMHSHRHGHDGSLAAHGFGGSTRK